MAITAIHGMPHWSTLIPTGMEAILITVGAGVLVLATVMVTGIITMEVIAEEEVDLFMGAD